MTLTIELNTSINAHIGMPATSVYAASKAGLLSLAKSLSGELIGRGIRVNAVSPGPISTPLYGKLGMAAADLEKTAADIQAQAPSGRFGHAAKSRRPWCSWRPTRSRSRSAAN